MARRRVAMAVLVVAVGATAAPAATWRSEGPFLGAVVDVAIDPVQPDTLFAATGAGGVWRSDDGGQSWTLPDGELVSRPVRWIEVDPGDPATLWVGVEVRGGPGLWRSRDRGKSWEIVRPDRTSYALGQPIAFAPSRPKTIYVPSTNLHFRSADGGKTWESFRVAGQDAYAFAIHPEDPKIIYAGGRGTEHNLRRSVDAGKTWKPAGAGLPESSINRVVIPRGKPSTVYVVSASRRVHKSENGGDTWTEIDLGVQSEVFSLDLDPHDPQVLFAGTGDGLRKSTDGGTTWSAVGGGLGRYYCKSVAFHPTRKGLVYAGTTGKGFFKSTDGGESFEPSGAGLAAGWVEKIYAPPTSAGTLFAQMSVGLYRRDEHGTWIEIQAPFAPGKEAEIDGIVFDRVSPKKVYAHEGARWWRSEDGGRAWAEIEVPSPSMKNMIKGRLSAPGFKSLAQDIGDPKIFYAGSWSSHEEGSALFRSMNGGKKWELASSGIPGKSVTLLRAAAPGVLYAVGGKDAVYHTSDGGRNWTSVRTGEVTDLAADVTRPERVYVATKQGLFRSGDSGATWVKAAGIKGDEVHGVAVSPKDGQVFAGTFEGLFRSTDGGATWTAFSDGLLNTDVRAIAVGGDPARLYVGLAGGSIHSIELP